MNTEPHDQLDDDIDAVAHQIAGAEPPRRMYAAAIDEIQGWRAPHRRRGILAGVGVAAATAALLIVLVLPRADDPVQPDVGATLQPGRFISLPGPETGSGLTVPSPSSPAPRGEAAALPLRAESPAAAVIGADALMVDAIVSEPVPIEPIGVQDIQIADIELASLALDSSVFDSRP